MTHINYLILEIYACINCEQWDNAFALLSRIKCRCESTCEIDYIETQILNRLWERDLFQ